LYPSLRVKQGRVGGKAQKKMEESPRGTVGFSQKNLCHKELSARMSIPVSIDRLQGKERKEIIKMVQHQAKQAALEAIRPIFVDFLEAEVEEKLGRKKGMNRHVSSQKRAIDWTCG